MKRLLIAATAVTISTATSSLAQREGFAIESTRSVGMGGTGAALPGMENAVFLNPALLAVSSQTEIRMLDVQAVFNQNTFTQYDFYKDHHSQFESLDDMTDQERNQFYYDMLDVARDETVFGFQGMAPLAFLLRGFSFGVYERARVHYDLREGASSVPYVHADAVAEGEVIVGKAVNLGAFFGKMVSVGANAKYLYRTVTAVTRSAPAVETIENVRVFRGGAVAFDLGVLVSAEQWSFGAGLYDFNYPKIRWSVNEPPPAGFDTPTGLIGGSLRLGIAYQPRFGIRGLLDRFNFALDVQSPMSDKMGFFKKISLGSEARFGGMLRVRAGLHQGYPAAGAGINIKVFKVDYAFTGEALGRYPGQLDSWNHYVSVGLGYGY